MMLSLLCRSDFFTGLHGGCTLNKLFGNNVTNFFSIFGAIGTLLSTYTVYYAFFTDSEDLSSTGISRIQEAAATVMAPSGFTVKPALLSKVPSDADFSSNINKPILVTDSCNG